MGSKLIEEVDGEKTGEDRLKKLKMKKMYFLLEKYIHHVIISLL